MLQKFLGPPVFSLAELGSEDRVGVVTGLAWTAAGGQTLVVEAIKMRGKGNLSLRASLAK
jgi:ATP-dependent Lon protease